MAAHLLSIDDLEPLLHLATLCAPALLVSDQRDVGVFRDAVITCAAVNALSIIVITQVVIATVQRGYSGYCGMLTAWYLHIDTKIVFS